MARLTKKVSFIKVISLSADFNFVFNFNLNVTHKKEAMQNINKNFHFRL